MSRKRFTPEQIIGKLREADAAFAQRAPGRQQPGGMEDEKVPGMGGSKTDSGQLIVTSIVSVCRRS